MQEPRPFKDHLEPPADVAIPTWLVVVVIASVVAGVLGGALSDGPITQRLARAAFFGSAIAYASTAVVDFWEHTRIEIAVSGSLFPYNAIPIGEAINHVLNTSLVIAMIVLVGPIELPLDARDVFVLIAPLVFLAFGWHDELIYHRRRCRHREDMMHTVAHQACGMMLTSLYLMRLI